MGRETAPFLEKAISKLIQSYGYGKEKPPKHIRNKVIGKTFVSPGTPIYGANFDGSNDYLTRGAGFTGISDGKIGTAIFRFKPAAIASNLFLMNNDTNRFRIDQTGSKLRIVATDTAGSDNLVYTNNTALSNGTEYTVHFAWDLGSSLAECYVDNSDDGATPSTLVDSNIDYTVGNWLIGSNNGLTAKFNGVFRWFWFDTVYIDPTDSAERAKIYGTDGELALSVSGNGTPAGGSQPLVFLAGTYDQWESNKGSGGGFTENGELTAP